MAQSARGLGRGLEALLGGLGDATSAGEIMMIPLGRIRPNPDQPRREFSEEAMADLTRSVKEQGVLQPVVVRPVRDDAFDYEIVAGERRWRACGLAGLEEIPALVREVDDEQSLALALIENLQREDLNPMEEAAGFALLLSRFGLSQEELADRVGKSRSAVANTLRLMQLSEPIRADLGSGRITAGHARALLSLTDEALRDALWRRILELGMSVRQAEDLAAYAKIHGAFPELAAPDAAAGTAKAGGAGKVQGARRAAAPMDKELHELQASLEDLYGVKVRVSGTPGRGRITFHFGTEEARLDIEARLGLRDA
jgi:ParB family chromosome partitioning protein